jgi:hypothetical protein
MLAVPNLDLEVDITADPNAVNVFGDGLESMNVVLLLVPSPCINTAIFVLIDPPPPI